MSARPAGRGSIVVIGIAVVVLAVLAAGTAAVRNFRDGVPDGADLGLHVLIGVVLGAAIGGLVVLGLRRLGPTGMARLGLASGAAVVCIVVLAAAIGGTAGVASTHLGPRPPDTNVDENVRGVDRTFTTRPVVENLDVDVDVPSWVSNVLAVVGVILLLVLVLGFTRTFSLPSIRVRGGLRWGNRGRSETIEEDLDVEAAADVLDDSISAVGAGGDPRSAIIAAYARLLDGLAEVGCARLPYEAPEEHLHRSLLALGVSPEAMSAVVDKFLVARFSTHPVTEADRDEVRDALRAAAAQLRAILAARTVAAT